MFLRTLDAHAYFARHGFAVIRQDLVPAAMLVSRQFQGACPSCAAVMELAQSGLAVLQALPVAVTVPALKNSQGKQA
jgi:N-acetylglutamate synthase-like GNAT family acetyltransferase